jgi:hypothetical protein
MKKKKFPKLTLSRETLWRLSGEDLKEAAGGMTLTTCDTWPCTDGCGTATCINGSDCNCTTPYC